LKHKLEYLPVTQLTAYETNSRTHSAEQINQIAASINEFGFTNPVLIDPDNTIIAGHGRVQAAKQIGMDEVPCLRLSHLTEAQRKAYVIADNKLALNAGWDDELLRQEIAELKDIEFDISLLGFSEEELNLIEGNINFEPSSEDDQGKLDQLEPKWVACPHCGKEFDLREQN
jgi:ParB-like chromosome segregation protein Spo0J